VSGWLDLKEWLKPYNDGAGEDANLKIFSTCGNIIRCLPQLQHDQHNPNDCAGNPHEVTHGPDALRYFVAGRPRPNAKPEPKPVFNFKSERPKPNPSGYGEKVRVI
jgi:phage terminase large subunit